MRRIFFALLLPALAGAAIWPDSIGSWKRTAALAVTLQDRALWSEYGFQEAETATYEAESKSFSATAYRLQDSTGAFGAFEWQRAADATASGVAPLAAETRDGLLLAHGNYLVAFRRYKPSKEEAAGILQALPRAENPSLPELPGYMPAEDLIANSERYVIGPVGLERFSPGIPPSVAAFHMGAEARVAGYNGPGGPMRLALFNYPTPQLAMQQAGAFQKLSGALVKRSGPLVAVIVAAPNADAAEHVLARVRYQASVTMSEYVPTLRDNVANLILNVFELTGVLLLFALVAGLAFGGLRALRRATRGQEPDAMIVLNLDDRR